MATDRMICPRCGESLPRGFVRCDACGASLVASSTPEGTGRGHERPQSKGGHAHQRRPVPGVEWLLFVAGISVGGLIGYALHSAIGPRSDDRMPSGPADIPAGSDGSGAPASGMPGGAGMPPQIMQMVQSYKAALAKNPNDLDANIGLGNLDFDSGQWSDAIERYTRPRAGSSFDSSSLTSARIPHARPSPAQSSHARRSDGASLRSYHGGSRRTVSPSAAARSSVFATTAAVLQGTPSKIASWLPLIPTR